MIIAYVGLDGSGKTYHMAEVAQRMLKSGIDVFGNIAFDGGRLLENHRQLIRIENAHIFFDEWHQDHDAKQWYNLDPVLRHIVTQHRKYKLVIHWSAQSFFFMDSYVRRETTFVWDHEALFRDPDNGRSKVCAKLPFIGEIKGLHRAIKYPAWEVELKHRHPKILEKKTFFIRRDVFESYDSYKKIMLSSSQVTDAELQAITDPYAAPKIENVHEVAAHTLAKRDATILMTAPDPSEDKDANLIREEYRFDRDNERENDVKLIQGNERPDDFRSRVEVVDPIENLAR